MSFIAVIGCDGSGKTTVVNALREHYWAQSIPTYTGHWRPKLFEFLTKNKIQKANSNPHGGQSRSYYMSSIKILYLYVIWTIAWYFNLKNKSRTGMVIFDRYYIDLLVDTKRYRYGGSIKFANTIFTYLPKPQSVFYLDARPEVLIERKHETSTDCLINLQKKYRALCVSESHIHRIDAEKATDQIIKDITGLIRAGKEV